MRTSAPLPSSRDRRDALRYADESMTGPKMRNCGKQLVLLAVITLTLAACGGVGEGPADGAPGANNLPPLIAGTPVTTLAAGSFYSFTPTAGDPDGDSLTFNATNV